MKIKDILKNKSGIIKISLNDHAIIIRTDAIDNDTEYRLAQRFGVHPETQGFTFDTLNDCQVKDVYRPFSGGLAAVFDDGRKFVLIPKMLMSGRNHITYKGGDTMSDQMIAAAQTAINNAI